MGDTDRGPSAPLQPRDLTLADLRAALAQGLRDFLRAPMFGIFFSSVYVAGGILLWLVYAAAGQEWWLAPVAVGFPLFAPFAAVGLYEVSRRIEAGERLDWRGVLGVVLRQKDRQVPMASALIVVIFLFWVFVAHAIFALFMGLRAFSGQAGIADLFLTGNGPLMLAVGGLIGAGFAGLIFATAVTGLPHILDREVDVVTAMITSVSVVLRNPGVMAVWAGVIAVGLLAAMLPMFLGLFLALPVFGHATWALYRRALAEG
jgi:uncharacterized membrane protein